MGKPNFVGLTHICITVDNISEAFYHYKRVLGAEPYQYLPNYKNKKYMLFSKHLKTDCSTSIGLLKIPNIDLMIEIIKYHCTKTTPKYALANINANTFITLKVDNIQEAFAHIQSQADITVISNLLEYPTKNNCKVRPDTIYYFTPEQKTDWAAKEKVAALSKLTYFCFIDRYGVHWVLEEANIKFTP